jgi:IS5 family transposase
MPFFPVLQDGGDEVADIVDDPALSEAGGGAHDVWQPALDHRMKAERLPRDCGARWLADHRALGFRQPVAITRHRACDATAANSTPPQQILYSIGTAAVALGVARGMLDAFIDLACRKSDPACAHRHSGCWVGSARCV